MKWYTIKYLYQVMSGNGNHEVQINEQSRLMHALSLQDAVLRAYRVAKGFNQSFKNFNGDWVNFKFIGLKHVQEIMEPADGVELASEIIEVADIQDILKQVSFKKKRLIKSKSHTF